MKILFVNHGLNNGGATSSLWLLMKGLKEQGHELHLMVPFVHSDAMRQTMARECADFEILDCGQFHSNQAAHSPLHKLVREPVKYLVNRTRLRDYIRAKGIEIVHLNSSVLAHLLPYLERETTARLCVHVRELLSPSFDPYGIGNYLIRTIERHAHQIICISENETAAFGGAPNLAVVYNSFDFAELQSVPVPHTHEKPMIMMMGQFSRNKGQIEFLSAVRQLRESRPDIVNSCIFRLVGVPANKDVSWRARLRNLTGDTYYEDFVRLREEWCLQDTIELSPYVADVRPQLAQASVLVRASLSGDPWGRDIIEAMAFGKAIIATGSYNRFACPGENAILVPPGNSNAMAQAITEMMDVPGRMARYGARSATLACELFDYHINAKKVDTLYAALMN